MAETEVSQLEFYYYTPNDVGGDLRSEADFSGELTLDYASKVAESAALSARTPENVLCTQYGVSVKGTKEDIWNYMQAVADIDEAVMINSVSIADYTFGAAGETATTTDEEGNQVSVTVGGGENRRIRCTVRYFNLLSIHNDKTKHRYAEIITKIR